MTTLRIFRVARYIVRDLSFIVFHVSTAVCCLGLAKAVWLVVEKAAQYAKP